VSVRWVGLLAVVALAGCAQDRPAPPPPSTTSTTSTTTTTTTTTTVPETPPAIEPAPPPTDPPLLASGHHHHEDESPAMGTGEANGGGWEALRQCESGGDYSNHDGQYAGAYQFDRQTWGSVGGTGDPADASPAEQDARAQRLYDERGASPWPACGRSLG